MANNLPESETTGRLCILLILELYGAPLEKNLLLDFIHHKNIIKTDDLSRLLEDLEASHMLKQVTDSFSLTETGRVSLAFFKDRIPLDLQYTLEDLVGRIKPKIGQEALTSWSRSPGGDYEVTLTLIENDQVILSLTLNVPSLEHAQNMMRRWKEHSEYLYGDILGLLTK
jgi:hypothetical protein